MDFFGMGWMEVLLILIIALLIWGPGKLPEIARTMGRMVATLRRASNDLTTQVRRELEMEETRNSPSHLKPDSPAEEKEAPDSTAEGKKLPDGAVAEKVPSDGAPAEDSDDSATEQPTEEVEPTPTP